MCLTDRLFEGEQLCLTLNHYDIAPKVEGSKPAFRLHDPTALSEDGICCCGIFWNSCWHGDGKCKKSFSSVLGNRQLLHLQHQQPWRRFVPSVSNSAAAAVIPRSSKNALSSSPAWSGISIMRSMVLRSRATTASVSTMFLA